MKDRVVLSKAKAKFRILHNAKVEADNAFFASMRDKYAFTSKYGSTPPHGFPIRTKKQTKGKVLAHPSWNGRFMVVDRSEGDPASGWEFIENNFEVEKPQFHKRNPAFDDPELE